MHHRAAAHGAGLQGDVERAAVQPVVAQRFGSSPERDDLGMRRGVMPVDRRVAACGDHLALFDHNRAHRHLAGNHGKACLSQSRAHEDFMHRLGLR